MAVRPSLHPKHRPIAYLSRTQYKTRTSRNYLETDALETTALIHAVRLYLNCSHRIYGDFTHFYGRSAVITPQTPSDRLPKPHSIQNTNFPQLPETDALETTALLHAVRLYLHCSHRIYREFTHSSACSAVITPQTPPDRLPKPHSIQNTNFPPCLETDALETTALIQRRSLVSQLFS
jgi:hypothetical protein